MCQWKVNFRYNADPAAVEPVVRQTLLSRKLLRGVARLGIAVSGGADSVALLHLLLPICREKKIEPVVLHLNHGLREASEQEAVFVQELASQAGVQCISQKRQVTVSAGVSLEMAAREVRQTFYAECCASARLDAIATGHNADDVAETLLLRLARGAGATGLSPLLKGGARRAGVCLLRPLLNISANALRDWLRQRGIAWCEDASNADTGIPRNRVRHDALPTLENAFGHALRPSLCRTADILREEDNLLDALAQRQMKKCVAGNALLIKPLLKRHLALRRRIVRLWLFENGAAFASGFDTGERLLGLCADGAKTRLQLTDGVAAVSDGTVVILVRRKTPAEPVVLVTDEICCWRNLTFLCSSAHGVESVAHGIGNYPAVCTIDPDACDGLPLVVRSRKPGDRLAPYGMRGTKKVQDIFVDEKVPEYLRDTIPLLTCGGAIVWIPGFRIAQPFAVQSSTSLSLRVETDVQV
ncbi:MAG: tRNA lysidine(34) synthetase TilS [Kiritimatiellaeota bacterium]|nr:tRNA lysidine(34) synthetase TilS [Kiritimatiellota bacterium]